MRPVIMFQKPTIKTELPAHEQAARRRRAADGQLPAIPGHTGIPGRTAQPGKLTINPDGRKTINLDLPNLRY